MRYTTGDANIVRNLRRQYGEALEIYTNLTIAKAWRDFSRSDEYFRRNEEPNLFLEWVEMEHNT